MYETEANRKVESAEQIPLDVITAFGDLKGKIVTRTVLPWSEHCTECVWPTCYKTCDLYSAREDGRCRRFVDGMVRVDCPTAVNHYLLKIRFKQWGKIWTPGNLKLRSSKKAVQIEGRDYHIGMVLYLLPLPQPVKKVVIGKRYSWKKKQVSWRNRSDDVPTSFLLECFNPSDQVVDLSLSIRFAGKDTRIPYQKLLRLNPGFQLVRIPFAEIAKTIDLRSPFNIELIPNSLEKEITLFFGLMEFVQEIQPPIEKNGKIKCVVWDLDNTLWDGVLVEQDPAQLTLKPGIRNIIEALDRRGILQSISSKNNQAEAVQALMRLELDQFFLYPQISWTPKGEAIKTIARLLNIGLDAMLFVDDQEFERRQVESVCPEVRTLDARDYCKLLEMKELQVPVTDESAKRRVMYRIEQERQETQEDFKDDYKAFLKHCDIRLEISNLTEQNLERVHELTQRTNQMNFSGSRYDRDLLCEVMQSSYIDTYVLACEDRFGSYGIVGFGMVDRREPRLTDLMFSCRIQSKRVEHAFLRFIIQKYITNTGRDFHANYRKTVRNMQSGQVFEDLHMVEVGISDGVSSLIFSHEREVSDDGIVKLTLSSDRFVGSPQ
jgi:FkbH-like protein